VKPLARITLVVPPIAPPFSSPPGQSPERIFHDYDRFAAELQRETPARVEIFEGMPNQAPREGMLLVAPPHGLDDTPGLVDRLGPRDPRPIFLNANVSDYEELAPVWRPAGIVPNDRYARWRLQQDDRLRRHLYGLRSLAPALAPLLIAHEDWRNPSYSAYSSTEVLMLASVVARYIDAYWKSLG
jgi:hypothetical protein